MTARILREAGFVVLVEIEGREFSADVTESVEAILDVEKRIVREESEDELNRLTLENMKLKKRVSWLESCLNVGNSS